MNPFLDTFSREVEKVVTASYSVSLAGLHRSLAGLKDCSIEFWADCHPRQVPALASAVLEGLQIWPYALDILMRLSCARPLRDAFIIQKPGLLDALLKNSLASDHGYQEYIGACISLLRHPFPPDMVAPSLLSSYFARILETAVTHPSAETLRPVYSLVSGGAVDILDPAFEDLIVQKQDRLIRILKDCDVHSISLLCLAIFAEIITRTSHAGTSASERSSSQDSTSSDVVSSPTNEGRLQPLRQFFAGTKAQKIVHLVILRVVSACSDRMEFEDALESLRLAVRIMDATEHISKQDYLRERESPKVIRKMYEKLFRSGKSTEFQLIAINFLSSLLSSEPFPVEMQDFFRESLLEAKVGEQSPPVLELCSSLTLQKFSLTIDQRWVDDVLQQSLRTATDSSELNEHTFWNLKRSFSVIHWLGELVQSVTEVRRCILSALATNNLQHLLSRFISVQSLPVGRNKTCGGQGPCIIAFTRAHGELVGALCSLFLKAGLCAQTEEVGIETTLALSLLTKQKDLANPVPACPTSTSVARMLQVDVLSLTEQNATPSALGASNGWREKLAADLMQESVRRHGSIISTVGQICRDLEDRCTKVEEPLRVEQERCEQLQKELHGLGQRMTQLSHELDESRLFSEGLEVERSTLEADLVAANAAADELRQRVFDLESALRRNEQDLQNVRDESNEIMKRQELEHLAIVTARDEEIDELREANSTLRSELEATSDKLSAREQAYTKVSQGANELEKRLREAQDHYQSEILKSERYSTEAEAMKMTESMLMENIDQLRCELLEKQAAESAAVTQLAEVEKAHLHEVGDLKQQMDSAASIARAEAERTGTSHRMQIETLKAEFQRQDEENSIVQQQLECRVRDLEGQVRNLLEERKAKAREFAEAQSLTRRLVAFMNVESASVTSGTRDGEDINIPANLQRTPVIKQDKRIARSTRASAAAYVPENQHDFSEEESTNKSSRSNSTSLSGPTPKRTKLRRSSRVRRLEENPSLEPTHTGNNISSPEKCSVLRLTSFSNSQHTRRASERSSKGKNDLKRFSYLENGKENKVPELASESDIFSSDEMQHLLTSTQQNRGQTDQERDIYDDTTVDFH